MKKATGSKLYRVSWFCLTGTLTSISCAFSTRSSLMQIHRNSFRRHSVLMLLSSSSVIKSSLLFGFCTACMLSYRCLQMEWWIAVTVVVILSQLALLMWRYILAAARPSVLSPRASRFLLHSRHPAGCVLPIFVRKPAVGVISATRIPKRLRRFHGICSSLKYYPSINFPASCLSIKSDTHVP